MRLHGHWFRFWRWLRDFRLGFRTNRRNQIQAAAPDQVSAAAVTAESAAFLAVLYDENAAMLNSALLAYFFY
jgi:hypothetical protein